MRDLLALVFEVDAAAISATSVLADFEKWSSLTFVVMHVGIEKRFGITVEAPRLLRAATVGELAVVIGDCRRGIS